mmetsp:Transcript_21833/g.33334  ORF Transcript_21833/g.33334 Transcript_21833/m.33334 type:complete len:100 (-) Transcript_21833:161-460(-)
MNAGNDLTYPELEHCNLTLTSSKGGSNIEPLPKLDPSAMEAVNGKTDKPYDFGTGESWEESVFLPSILNLSILTERKVMKQAEQAGRSNSGRFWLFGNN